MVDVVITRNHDIEAALVSALEKVPLSELVQGRRVAVKPNETWASGEDTTGITQPDTLRAVLRAVKRHSPRELVVSGGAGAAETDEVFRIGSLMEVALAADVVGARLLGFTPQAVRHLWEAVRLGIGEGDTGQMRFPALSLRDAIGHFTEAAYGRRLDFEHA